MAITNTTLRILQITKNTCFGCRWRSLFTTARLSLKYTESIITAAATREVYKPKTIFRRPLDGFESLNHNYYKRCLVQTYNIITLKSMLSLKEECVRQALAMVAKRQPLLNATVIDSASGMYFEYIHGYPVDIDFRVIDRDIDDALVVMEDLMNDSNSYRDVRLWRAVLLREKFDITTNCYRNAVIIFGAHSIIDGTGLSKICQQLHSNIEAITKGTAADLKDIHTLPLLPSSSTLLTHKLRKLQKSTMPSCPRENESYINPVLSDFPTIEDIAKAPNQPFTKLIWRTIPNKKLTKLIVLCRNHNCTLTGALLATCHIAFCSLLQSKSSQSHLTNDIKCFVNTSNDQFPRLPSEYISTNVAHLKYELPLAKDIENFWEIASSCSSSVHSDIRNKKHLEFIAMLDNGWQEYLKNVLQQAKLKLANRNESSQALSNPKPFLTGNDPNNAFHIESSAGVSPVHGRFGTFGNYLKTVNGVANWMTAYDASIISTDVATKYCDHIGEIIDNLLG